MENNFKETIISILQKFVKNELDLIDNDVHEIAISSKLAHYLTDNFKDLNVDCEYNRHGKNIKRLSSCGVDLEKDNFRSDITIHKRLSDENNLIIIEIKKSLSESELNKVKERVFKIKSEFKYKKGFILSFNKEYKDKFKLYEV